VRNSPSARPAPQFADDLAPGGAVDRDGCNPGGFLEISVQAAAKSAFRLQAPNEDLNRPSPQPCWGLSGTTIRRHGMFRSLWMLRLATVADDTQRLIDELSTPIACRPELPLAQFESQAGGALVAVFARRIERALRNEVRTTRIATIQHVYDDKLD